MTHGLQEAAFMLNIPDVWHVRNGMLWAAPFEQARLLSDITALLTCYA